MLTTGAVLQNRYRIVSVLEQQGAMSVVYRAWHLGLNTPVAIKEMTLSSKGTAEMTEKWRRQFQEEALTLARLNHPNLVDVLDYFEVEGDFYLVMRFVEGESLFDHISREGAIPEATVLEWTRQLLDALSHCHSSDVVHRDIKPQNIIIRSDGQAVLVDFGLVKHWDPDDPATRTIILGMGTPEYAPPEQYSVHSGHTGPWSDIYSLGATLHHALTGQAPLSASQRMAAPEHFQTVREINQAVSKGTAAVIARAMSLQLSARFTGAQEMQARLGQVRRSKAGITVAIILFLALIATAVRLFPGSGAKATATPERDIEEPAKSTVPHVTGPTTSTSLPPPTVVEATSTVLPTLTTIPSPVPATPSPTSVLLDAGLIAYEVESNGIWSILLIHPDGTGRRFLTGALSSQRVPKFSPVDGRLTFRAMVGNTWQIFTIWPDGQGLRQLTHPPGHNLEAAWSPDGRRLVFVSDQDGRPSIAVMNANGGSQISLTDQSSLEDDPAWSPDGQWIAFESDRSGDLQIYKIRPDGNDLTRLTFDRDWSGTPAWSPDGEWIAFESGYNDQEHIWIMRPDGSDQQRLTVAGPINNRPAWSPGGGHIAFTSNRSGLSEIWIMAADGTDARQLTHEGGAVNAAWSP
jgi:tRNA A-37 threonylcarbamoyl transferase component Bud32